MAVPLRADFRRCWRALLGKEEQGRTTGAAASALAAIGEGASRTEAARTGGVTLQIVRDWCPSSTPMVRRVRSTGRLRDSRRVFNDAHRATLAAIIESGPIPTVHGIVRWRIVDLCQWIFEEFRVVISRETLSPVTTAGRYGDAPRPGANQCGELFELDGIYCISRPGSDRSFALTVPRPPYTPNVPLAAQPNRGSEGRSHRTSIIFPFVSMAQIERAILLARAIATSMRGFLRSSHEIWTASPHARSRQLLLLLRVDLLDM